MASHYPTKVTARPGEREIHITRAFDAPREVVFKAFSDPKLLEQWWGPRRYTTTVEKMDFKRGGKWRFIHHSADGQEFAFNGEFREVAPPERIVMTFEFEGMPGHVSVETATFEEKAGKTTMTVITSFDSVEDRDGMLNSGMESGMAESHDRLDEVLERETAKTAT